jgi:menaquinone-dependent protoporphyrinogen oxidase
VEINMATPILVTYATLYGSTQEVAGAVATTLREQELEVEIQPLQQVAELDHYRAVVLGAPLYMFHWPQEARQFLAQYREALSARPAAVFALGPIQAGEHELRRSRAQLDAELAKFPWLQPCAIAVFGGKFDPQSLTPAHSRVPALKRKSASDVRDWPAIRAWASDLAGLWTLSTSVRPA